MNAPELKYLPIAQLIESTTNYRRAHDEAKHQELVASIRQHGILTPLVVRQVTQDPNWIHEVAAGHRRLRAGRVAGVEMVPVTVREMDDREFAEIMITENLQRVDPDPLDEADAFQELISTLGYDVATLAAKFGKSETYVRQRLVLTRIVPEVRTALAEGAIELGHAVLLARVDEDRQRELLQSELLGRYRVQPAVTRANILDENEEEQEVDATEPVLDVARTRTTVGELRRVMAESLLPLAPVKWDRDDATLVPTAGSCTACPKRTGANPMLFAEFDPADDRCPDASCYGAKKHAYIEARVQACRSQAPTLVVISTAYSRKLKDVAGLPVLKHHVDWAPATVGKGRNVPAIVVETNGDVGNWNEFGELCEVQLITPQKKAKADGGSMVGGTKKAPQLHSNEAHRLASERFVLGVKAVILACQAADTELDDHCTALFQEDMATPNGVHQSWQMRQLLRAVMDGTLAVTSPSDDQDDDDDYDEGEDDAAYVAAAMAKRPPVTLRTSRLAASLARARLHVPYYSGWNDEPPIDPATDAYQMPEALTAIGTESGVDAGAVWREALQRTAEPVTAPAKRGGKRKAGAA